MTFSTRIQDAARRTINKLGVVATITSPPTLDADTGESTAGTAAATVASPPSVRRGYVSSDGAMVREATFAYCLPDVVPQTGGTLTIGSTTWRIVSVLELNPGTAAACYRMEVAS